MGRLLKTLAYTEPSTVIDFLTALPSGWTYSRPDTTGTHRNSSGKMVSSGSNTPRFNYDISGTALGLRQEGQRVNRFSNYNVVPTAVADFSVTGTATIGVTTDATAIGVAKLDLLVTNNVFEASGGASGGTVVLPGTTGSTSNSSFSTWARITAGTSCTLTHNGTSPGTTTISGAAYARFKLENQTISGTGVQMVLTIPAGTTVRFILCQIEVAGFCSSEIITSGAAATRFLDGISDTSLTSRDWFRVAKGAIIADVTLDNIGAGNAGAMCAFFVGSGTANFTNCIGVSTTSPSTRRKSLSRYYVASSQQLSTDVGSLDATDQRYAFATSWVDGQYATMASGAGTYQTFNVGTLSGIDRLYVGARGGNDPLFGHVRRLKVYKNYRTPRQLARDMVRPTDFVVHTAGQSNQVGWFAANTGSNNTGEITAKALLDAAWPSSRNWIANGGTNATSLLYYAGTSTATNWWYDAATGAYGIPLQRWIDIASSGGVAKFITWILGESDAGNCTKQQFKDAVVTVAQIMRSVVGPVPIIMVPLGKNTSLNNGYQTINEAIWELPGEQSYIYRAPERQDLALDASGLHLTDTTYGTCASRTIRKALKVLGETVVGGVDGPSITNVVRSGTNLTVTISHDGGTDFTPTTSIEGFEYFNGSDFTAPTNALTSRIRADAVTITMQLNSASAGTLYYGRGSLTSTNQSNMVIDNSPQALPLKASKWTVA